jgi:hypothetical protein
MLHRAVGRRTLVMSGAVLAGGGWPLRLRAQPALELGVLPHLSTRTLMGLYRPVREGLQKQLQRNVQISTAPDWARFHQRVLALDYDCMVSAAHLARLAQVDAGWIPLASYAPPIQALLIAARHRPLSTPQALKGGRLVLANRQSRVITVRTIGEVPAFVVSASPRLTTANRRELFRAWLAFGRDDTSAAFYAGSAFRSIEPVAADALKALDHVLPQSRQWLGAST